MPISLTLLCVWALLACLVGLGPRRFHWPAAIVLIATGLPLLGYVGWEMGVIWFLVAMAAAASVLRWPVYYLLRAVRQRLPGGARADADGGEAG